MMSEINIRVNAGKTILQLAAQFSNAPSAIWEYVNNALEYRENPDGCRITVDIERTKIIIADNSSGMDSTILKNFFTIISRCVLA